MYATIPRAKSPGLYPPARCSGRQRPVNGADREEPDWAGSGLSRCAPSPGLKAPGLHPPALRFGGQSPVNGALGSANSPGRQQTETRKGRSRRGPGAPGSPRRGSILMRSVPGVPCGHPRLRADAASRLCVPWRWTPADRNAQRLPTTRSFGHHAAREFPTFLISTPFTGLTGNNRIGRGRAAASPAMYNAPPRWGGFAGQSSSGFGFGLVVSAGLVAAAFRALLAASLRALMTDGSSGMAGLGFFTFLVATRRKVT